MLPRPYELPGALLLVLGGALACFAGYRLFRIVLAVYGFVFGAMLASSIMGITNTIGMLGAALVGGAAGAAVLGLAWFVGVAIVGAGLGVFVAHQAYAQVSAFEPPAWAVVVSAILGSAVAMTYRRIVVVLGTAFAGAWTLVVGVANIAAIRAGAPPASGSVWILYPLTPASGNVWVPVAWIVLGLMGTVIQLNSDKGRRKKR